MADITPNYTIEIQGLELEHSQLTHNIRAQEYRKAQMVDESERINVNIVATRMALTELNTKIKSLKG